MGKSSINDGFPIATFEYRSWPSPKRSNPRWQPKGWWRLVSSGAIQFSYTKDPKMFQRPNSIAAIAMSFHSGMTKTWLTTLWSIPATPFHFISVGICWHAMMDITWYIYNRHCAVNLSRPFTTSEPPSNEAPSKRGDPTWDGAPGRER